MGREVRRVPLDFDWPLNKVWEGFVNPHWRECPESGRTCFDGASAAGAWLDAIVAVLLLAGSEGTRRPGGRMHPRLAGLWVAPTNAGRHVVPPDGELTALTAGLAGREPSFLGHDACDRWTAVRAIRGAAGVPENWGLCPLCGGHRDDPATRAAAESWKPTPPPEGEGWQLWETVSEGSPVSPVLPTRKAFLDWLVQEGGYTLEAAEQTVKDGGHPSLIFNVPKERYE